MNYIIVVYDYSGEPLRRIPENDLEVAKIVAEYFTDDLWNAVIYDFSVDKQIPNQIYWK